MFIRKIEVKNFKSFKELSIEPSNFNVLIGPNASGKTNFLNIFKFLRDIINLGLQNAISMQGGIDYLRNIHTNKKIDETQFRIEFEHNHLSKGEKKIKNKNIQIEPTTTITEFTIRYFDDGITFKVVNDCLTQEFNFYEISDIDNPTMIGTGILELHQIDDNVDKRFISEPALDIEFEDIIPSIFIDPKAYSHTFFTSLFIENPIYMPYPINARKVLGDISVYDLDGLKEHFSTSIAGKNQLEDNGENIAIVLKKILSEKELARQFFNYLNSVLPFVKDIEVEQILDKHLEIKIKESYTPNEYIPASLMSSGSVSLIAIIAALYFENEEIIIFEEPGNRIHPYLISKIINMVKDASERTQVFLTTHNPEIVKYAGIENVFCLSRSKDGFSEIVHTSNKNDVIEFMKNEIGLEELFVQNILSK